jgi:Stage II sporulation protein E (SpoIIE)
MKPACTLSTGELLVVRTSLRHCYPWILQHSTTNSASTLAVPSPSSSADTYCFPCSSSCNGGPDLAFSSGGICAAFALPCIDGDTKRRSVANLPLGILPDQPLAAGTFRFECGDLLAVVADRFPETVDSRDREFGMARIKEIVRAARRKELREISAELRAGVQRHGQQRDDQTILLVRRLVSSTIR